MNVVYQLRGTEFEWDSNKAESNIAKLLHLKKQQKFSLTYLGYWVMLSLMTNNAIASPTKRRKIKVVTNRQKL
jgi:uncharacterized DUF497 family protein